MHPRYPDYIYPFDYGHLDGTTSGGLVQKCYRIWTTVVKNGDGIDCWVGSQGGTRVTGMVTVVDGVKKDSEIKILLGCTHENMQTILECHQRGAMDRILVIRG